MIRTVIAGVAVLAAGLLSATSFADDGGTVKVNGPKIEGSIKKEDKKEVYAGFGRSHLPGVGAEYKLNLKGVQKISVTGKVEGTGRKVGLAILDDDGKPLEVTWWATNGKEAQLKYDVRGDGIYKLVIISDQPGRFSLEVAGTLDPAFKAKELEEKIDRLKQEIAATEAKLKELKAKKKP